MREAGICLDWGDVGSNPVLDNDQKREVLVSAITSKRKRLQGWGRYRWKALDELYHARQVLQGFVPNLHAPETKQTAGEF